MDYKKDTSVCQGCGEMRYKCWCDEVCQFCGKQAIACMQESETGYCDLDTRPFIVELKKKLLSGNNQE